MTKARSALVELLRLRYLLLWAQARSNPVKVVFLVACWLATVVLMLVLAAGGVSLASFARSAYQLRQVAGLVLTTVFTGALVGSLAFGAGVNEAFSDSSLRRFPVSSRQRSLARHVLVLLEPTWLLVAASEAGLAAGFCMVAGAPIGITVLALSLLLLINYLGARILAAVATRILSTGTGALASMMVSIAIPGVIAAAHVRTRGIVDRFEILAVAPSVIENVWPPSVTALALAGPLLADRFLAIVVLAAWTVGLGFALFVLENGRPPSGAYERSLRGASRWYDGMAACVGQELSPWFGKAMRYYMRAPQVRYNVVVVLLVIVQAGIRTRLRNDAAVVGSLTLVGLSTAALSLNMFGLDGAGLRRCWSLPVTAGAIVRAYSLCGLLLDLLLVPVALVCIALVSPSLSSSRMLALLAGSAVAGTFFYQAIGVWTSVLAPRATSFHAAWGQRWSGGANLVVGLGVFLAMWISIALSREPEGWGTAHWWLGPTAAVGASGLYVLSLRKGAREVERKRESLVAEVDISR